MRIFANLFLLLFLADGTFSVYDELLSLFSITAASGLRNFFAGIVILLTIPLYISLGIDKRLPKRVFLPLILFLYLCPLVPWFFPSLSGSAVYGPATAISQVLLCLLPYFHFRKAGGRGLLMTEPMFRSPFFSLKNTLVFAAVSLFVLPVALVPALLASANSVIEKETSGFVRLAPGGLRMTEKIYRLGNKTIRLAGMIHVGEREYYDDVVRSVSSGRTIILAEGVTDEKNLLRSRFGYGKMASVLGLTSQEKMQFKGRHIDEEEFETPESKENSATGVDILRADVDMSTFRPSTIVFLNALGKALQENPSFLKAMSAFNEWAKKNVKPEDQQTIMDDILYRRNKEVIRNLNKALPRYDTIVIPWGALHMPGIEKSVRERGFVLKENRERVSINFRRILAGR